MKPEDVDRAVDRSVREILDPISRRAYSDQGVGVCGYCGGTVVGGVGQGIVGGGYYHASTPKCGRCGAEPKPLAMVERRKEGR